MGVLTPVMLCVLLVVCLCFVSLANTIPTSEAATVRTEQRRLAEARKRLMEQLDNIVDDAIQGNEDLDDSSIIILASPSPSPSVSSLDLAPQNILDQVVGKLRAMGTTGEDQQKAAQAMLAATDIDAKRSAIESFAKTLTADQLSSLEVMSKDLAALDADAQSKGKPPLFPQLVSLVPAPVQAMLGNTTVVLNATHAPLQLLEIDEGAIENDAGASLQLDKVTPEQIQAAKKLVSAIMVNDSSRGQAEEAFRNTLSESQLAATKRVAELMSGQASELPSEHNQAESLAQDSTKVVLADILRLAKETFKNLSESQATNAAQVLSATTENRNEAMTSFLNSLTTEQLSSLMSMQDKLQHELASVFSQHINLPATIASETATSSLSTDESNLNAMITSIDSSGLFNSFVPFVKSIVLCGGVVVPALSSFTSHAAVKDVTPADMADTLAQFGIRQPETSDASQSSLITNIFVLLGTRMATFESSIPINMLVHLLGSDFPRVTEEIFGLHRSFTTFTEEQISSAHQVMTSMGLGFDDQSRVMQSFSKLLSLQQTQAIEATTASVFRALRSVSLDTNTNINTNKAQPSCVFVSECLAQVAFIKGKRGETVAAVAEQNLMNVYNSLNCNSISASASGAGHSGVSSPQQTEAEEMKNQLEETKRAFSKFLPLVDQVLMVAAVLPTLDSITIQHNNVSDVDISAAIQREAFDLDSDDAVADADDAVSLAMSNALTMLGARQAPLASFNALAMAFTLVGDAGVLNIKQSVIACAKTLFELGFNQDQIAASKALVRSLNEPLESARASVFAFWKSLTPQHQAAIQDMRGHVTTTVRSHMVSDKDEPSPEFIRLVNTEIRHIVSVLPKETNDSKYSTRARALDQALAAVLETEDSGPFRNMVPVLNQVTMCSLVVLPLLQANRLHVAQSTLDAADYAQAIRLIALHDSDMSDTTTTTATPTKSDLLHAVSRLAESIAKVNSIELLVAVAGDANVTQLFGVLVNQSKAFPGSVDDVHLQKARKVVMAIGSSHLESSLQAFLALLTPAQQSHVTNIQRQMINSVMQWLFDATSGQPAKPFVDFVEQYLILHPESVSGNVGGKQRDTTTPTLQDSQAMIGIDASASSKFQNVLLLLEQVLVRLVASSIVHAQGNQTQNSVFLASAEVSHAPKGLMTASETVVEGLFAIGATLAQANGFNPVEIAFSLLGHDQVRDIATRLLTVAQVIGEPSTNQTEAAKKLLVCDANEIQQCEANLFGSFPRAQSAQLDSSLAYVLNSTLSVMMRDGQPSPALIAELHSLITDPKIPKVVMSDSLRSLVHSSKQTMLASTVGTDAKDQALMFLQATPDFVQPQLPRFQQLLPLLNQLVVFAGSVLPVVNSSSADAFAQAVWHKTQQVDADAVLTSLREWGSQIGHGSLLNPVTTVEGIITPDEMKSVVQSLISLAARMPSLNATQLDAAQQLQSVVGRGFHTQQQSIENFINTLDASHHEILDSMQGDLVASLIHKMMDPNGEPSPLLQQQITSQLAGTFSNTTTPPLHDLAETMSMLVLRDISATEFSDFFPEIQNILLVAAVAMPSKVAKLRYRRVSELTQDELFAGFAEIAHVPADLSSNVFESLAVLAHGATGFHGPNPVTMLVNILNATELDHVKEAIANCAFHFPELIPAQAILAAKFVASYWSGSYKQQQPAAALLASLSRDQLSLFNELHTDIVIRFVAAATAPNGTPSLRLVAELQRNLNELAETNNGNETTPTPTGSSQPQETKPHEPVALVQMLQGEAEIAYEDEDEDNDDVAGNSANDWRVA